MTVGLDSLWNELTTFFLHIYILESTGLGLQIISDTSPMKIMC